MSTENAVLQQIMEEMSQARKSHLRSIRQIWASKATLSKALGLKDELESLGMEASVSSSLMSIGRVGLTINLNSDHSVIRDVLPVLEEVMEDYELVDTNKSSVKGEIEFKYCREVNSSRKVRLIVSIMTGKSSACRWIGTGKFIEIQDLICDEEPAA